MHPQHLHRHAGLLARYQLICGCPCGNRGAFLLSGLGLFDVWHLRLERHVLGAVRAGG
ncbi:hypothetical protein [Streptomyces griseorubiginosus]|uniref:hypothetical protein n=1 Tax=Streptomyces griseorubiginosus TaxID=67304 RepID=UPI001AD71226|nr:hypothetical protein [Streptomyces griseorubiginosus]MBO4260239.1 hypothetical protein [Streptomyces griseorubiginosus]